MKIFQLLSSILFLLLATSCTNEVEIQKEKQASKSIAAVKAEKTITEKDGTKVVEGIDTANKPIRLESQETIQMPTKQDVHADKIRGVWEVKNDYYVGIYEVEKYDNRYIGKIHYYNDGATEYKGKNSQDDYFLDGITYDKGTYHNGKMYMPDGSDYQVSFKLLSEDELEAKMTVQGSPYTEIWKRQQQAD